MSMADAKQTSATGGKKDFLIPDSVRERFKELIDLIMGSESMNDEERQYWFDILPVMTPDQVENLRSILTNERTQLAAIDAKYATDSQNNVDTVAMAEKRRESREKLNAQEQNDQSVEASSEEDILKQINEA